MNAITSDQYFQFEADFVEDNVRCIPMIIRFKLDASGIKLKLKEWSKMPVDEREHLATCPCETPEQTLIYKKHLQEIVLDLTGEMATEIPVIENPAWAIRDEIPYPLMEKLKEFNWTISVTRWLSLSDLQRFALLKLSYPGHENRNFPKAMKEFGLV